MIVAVNVGLRALARLAAKEAGKQAGKTAAYALLAELMGDDSRRFAQLDDKLDALQQGQEALRSQLTSIQADVGFRVPLDQIHSRVHGLSLALRCKEPTREHIKSMTRFLDWTRTDSARGLADDLSQKLFGSGQTTPDGFWVGGHKKLEKAVAPGRGHVTDVSHKQFHRNVASLKPYGDTMLGLHRELLSYFALLAGTIQAVNQYLLEAGNPFLREQKVREYTVSKDSNPALFKKPGLVDMATDWIMDYIIAIDPEAFDLYHSLFVDRRELRIGLTTKARNRILEWNNDASRKPIQVSGGMVPSHDYNGLKPVYADHTDNGRSLPNHWWRIEPAKGDGEPDNPVLIRTGEGEKYLGCYSYRTYSHMTNSGRQVSHSDEVGIADSRTSPKARWRLYLRRIDGKGETLFVLENVKGEGCLLVNGLDSSKDRQIHLDKKAADRGDWIDYAFKIAH